jgi:arsenite methyltransferase
MVIPPPFDVEAVVLTGGQQTDSGERADLSRHLLPGDHVLDVGCGRGESARRASEVVGPKGSVRGVDLDAQQIALAREHAAPGAVRYHRARVQDLALDLEALDRFLAAAPVASVSALRDLEQELDRLRTKEPLFARESVDVVLSANTLNLVRPEERALMFSELHRVLRRGGRLVLSELVSDEDVPARIRQDEAAWNPGFGGAYREDHLLDALEEAGFYGITLAERSSAPLAVKDGIEFRRVTILAYKGKEGPCFDQKHAVVYKGPFREVTDDDGHVLRRGMRVAVCEKTFRIYARAPYREYFELIEPAQPVPLEKAPLFPCTVGALRRDPRETKGLSGARAPVACAPASKGTSNGCC